jgi:hypothetical protein
MAEIPNLTQYDGTPVENTRADDPILDFTIPAAPDNPDLWDAVTFALSSGEGALFILPPAGMGEVDVECSPKVKLDSKGGAGKAKPRQSKTGGEATKVKIKITACAEAWPYLLAAARKILPGSGPWKVGHPAFDIEQITEIEIESRKTPKWDAFGKVVWEIEAQEVSPDAQKGKGGGNATDTPGSVDGQRLTAKTSKNNFTAKSNFGKADPNAKVDLQKKQQDAVKP